jgi:hypothetical protein
VVQQLNSISGYNFPVVVHPDVIFTPGRWRHLGDRLLVENMDRRKPTGRNVRELQQIFDWLPEARFCFDIGHARQVDPSMTESSLLLEAFGDRLAEVHISEVIRQAATIQSHQMQSSRFIPSQSTFRRKFRSCSKRVVSFTAS